MSPSALVVDDDPRLLRALEMVLRGAGWTVRTASTGVGALDAVAQQRPDVVLLDLGLPDLDGSEVLRRLRSEERAPSGPSGAGAPGRPVPVVVLTARSDSADAVAALDAGADDYVTKPFDNDELVARLRSAVRRAAPWSGEVPVPAAAGEVLVDLAGKAVWRGGAEVPLTPTEWGFLELLARHRGRTVGQREVLHEVWGPAYGTESNYLRVYAARLRRKLEVDPAHPEVVVTVPGIGYRFGPAEGPHEVPRDVPPDVPLDG